MVVVKVLGNTVNREAVRAAYNLATVSGSEEKVEIDDFKDAWRIVEGKKERFDFKKVEEKANYGSWWGEMVTRDEFAIYLQKLANARKQSITVIVKDGQKPIIVKPIEFVPSPKKSPLHHDAKIFASTPLVRNLIAPPTQKTPDRMHHHFKTGGYTYVIRDRYIFPWKFSAEKRGACSAYSIFAHFILKLAGYSPHFWLIYWPQKKQLNK